VGAQHDISFAVQHTPGPDALADWGGDLGHFVEIDTGSLVDVHVVALTGYFFAEWGCNEQMHHWLDGHSIVFLAVGNAS